MDRSDVNGRGAGLSASPPLVRAAKLGHAACVAALLAAPGIEVGRPDPGGGNRTALMWAAERGHAVCARALVAADGANANQTDSMGNTALIWAARGAQAGCVRALLAARGVAVNHANQDGFTALTWAASRNDTEGVRALVAAKGVDHSPRHPHSGWTALHQACVHKNAAMVESLLVAGSCRFAREAAPMATRRTPLALAGVSKEVRAAFLVGADYWQRARHGGHAWSMRRVVRTLLLVCHRLGAALPRDAAPAAAVAVRTARTARGGGGAAATHPAVSAAARPPPRLPEEIWLLVCAFLRSADFLPAPAHAAPAANGPRAPSVHFL